MGFWTRLQCRSAVLKKEADLCKQVYDETLKKREGRISKLKKAVKPWSDGCASLEVALGDMFKWIVNNHRDPSLKAYHIELLSAGGSLKYNDFSISVRLEGENPMNLYYDVGYNTETDEYFVVLPNAPRKADNVEDAIRYCEMFLNGLDALIEFATRYSAARREWLNAREAESVARLEGAKEDLEKLRRM